MAIPWWAKIGAKIVLSRLPLRHGFWQKLGLFRHGDMDSRDYSLRVFQMHMEFAGFAGDLSGKTLMELGPGDGVASAVLAAAHGARSILVDTGAYAGTDPARYVELANYLHGRGLARVPVEGCKTIEELLQACNAQYLTAGLASLRGVPDRSVDLIFSQAVLEHVRRGEFAETMQECRRVLKPGGAFTNHVDLKDHLGGALNNLRFEESVWEGALFSRSGFYTNRIRYSEMLEKFRKAGFAIEWSRPKSWEKLPTPRQSLAVPFRELPDEELRISGFDVLLR
jgi:SAM-dependent methyltransferase